MLKERQPVDRPFFYNGLPIPVRGRLYVEMEPREYMPSPPFIIKYANDVVSAG